MRTIEAIACKHSLALGRRENDGFERTCILCLKDVPKVLRRVARIVAERTATPSAEHQLVVTAGSRNGEDAIDRLP